MKKGVDYIGVAVGGLIRNEDGQFLLSLRSQHARNEKGKWEFLGGGVDYGETAEAAIVREAKEEHDIVIRVIGLLGVVDDILPEESQHWLAPSYLCDLVSGEPRVVEPLKCDGWTWVSASAVQDFSLSQASRKTWELYCASPFSA